jgi:Coenzyme Q (ubiquinone) biosynthesis protein Coq4
VTRKMPFPAQWTVRRALDAYLAENGFTKEGYDAAWTDASFFGIPFKVPNTARHRVALMLHDLHHVATGFGTDLRGEGEISWFELSGGGLRRIGLYVTSIIASGATVGAVLAPQRSWSALRTGRRSQSLFASKLTYEELLDLTVGELRAQMGVEHNGCAVAEPKLHAFAPKTA